MSDILGTFSVESDDLITVQVFTELFSELKESKMTKELSIKKGGSFYITLSNVRDFVKEDDGSFKFVYDNKSIKDTINVEIFVSKYVNSGDAWWFNIGDLFQFLWISNDAYNFLKEKMETIDQEPLRVTTNEKQHKEQHVNNPQGGGHRLRVRNKSVRVRKTKKNRKNKSSKNNRK